MITITVIIVSLVAMAPAIAQQRTPGSAASTASTAPFSLNCVATPCLPARQGARTRTHRHGHAQSREQFYSRMGGRSRGQLELGTHAVESQGGGMREAARRCLVKHHSSRHTPRAHSCARAECVWCAPSACGAQLGCWRPASSRFLLCSACHEASSCVTALRHAGITPAPTPHPQKDS